MYIVFLASTVLLPALAAGTLFHPYGVEGRTDYFTIFTPFIAGVVIAIFTYLISGKSKLFDNGSAFYGTLFTSIGFIATAFIGKDIVRVLPRSLGAMFTFREMNISGDIMKISKTTELYNVVPVYGYVSEILCGFILTTLIIVLFTKRKNGDGSCSLFSFKPIYVLWLLVPMITAIVDFFSQVLFQSVTKNIFIRNMPLFIRFIPILVFAFAVSLLMFIVNKSTYINKRLAILGIIFVTVITILSLYVGQTGIVEKSKILTYVFSGYAVVMYPLYCGGFLGISFRYLLCKK